MKSIVFQNSGEIDLRTVTTFGCSVKESDNPIGFFGDCSRQMQNYLFGKIVSLAEELTGEPL